MRLESELGALSAEEARLSEQIARESRELASLERDEAAHYQEYAAWKALLFDAEHEQRSLTNRVAHADAQLALLRRTNAPISSLPLALFP